MSGAGKSHWAQKLAGAGFGVISIDDRIEAKLAPELSRRRLSRHRRAGGMDGLAGSSRPIASAKKNIWSAKCNRWMKRWMKFKLRIRDGIVLDTTGSVIYTGEDICRRMQSLTTVVYLQAAPAEEAAFDFPVPVRPEARAVGRPICAARRGIRRGNGGALLSAIDRTSKKNLRTLRASRAPHGTPAQRRARCARFSGTSRTGRPGPRDEIPKHSPPQPGSFPARCRTLRFGAGWRTVPARGDAASAREIFGAAAVAQFQEIAQEVAASVRRRRNSRSHPAGDHRRSIRFPGSARDRSASGCIFSSFSRARRWPSRISGRASWPG